MERLVQGENDRPKGGKDRRDEGRKMDKETSTDVYATEYAEMVGKTSVSCAADSTCNGRPGCRAGIRDEGGLMTRGT